MTKELIVTLYISYPPKVHIYNNGIGLLPQNLTHYSDLYHSARGTGITKALSDPQTRSAERCDLQKKGLADSQTRSAERCDLQKKHYLTRKLDQLRGAIYKKKKHYLTRKLDQLRGAIYKIKTFWRLARSKLPMQV